MSNLFQLLKSKKLPAGSLKKNDTTPVLDNARNICQLAANSGSGDANVPGLQAAGLIAVQIVDIVKVCTYRVIGESSADRLIESEHQPRRLGGSNN